MKNENINKKLNYKKLLYFSFTILAYIIDICLLIISSTNEYYFFSGFIFLASSIIFLKEILKTRKIYSFKSTEHSSYEYWRDTDFEYIEPIYAGYLIGVDNININSIIATLFFLKEKEILNINLINHEYYISLNPKISEDKFNNLESYERKIVNLFFNSLTDTTKINLKEKLEQFDKNYDYKILLNNIYEEIEQSIHYKFYTNKPEIHTPTILLGPAVCNVIYGILIVVSSLKTKAFSFNLIFYIISLLLMLIYTKKQFHLKLKYLEEVKKLYGLYNFLSQYSLMKEQELKYVYIYNKFFIYAIGLGITDKVEKEFNQKDLNNNLKTNLQLLLDTKTKYNNFQKEIRKDLSDYALIILMMAGFLSVPLIISLSAKQSGSKLSQEEIILMLICCIPFLISLCIYVWKAIRILKYKKIKQMLNK